MTRHRSTSLVLAAALLSTAAATAHTQVLIFAAPSGITQSFAGGGASTDAAPDDYTKGTQALDQQRWQDAITDFDKVARSRDSRADAALYWKAYALNKLGRTGLVTGTCNQLRGTYPRSTWNKDCTTLYAAAADPGIYAAGSPAGQCIGCIHPGARMEDRGILFNGEVTPLSTTGSMRNLGALSSIRSGIALPEGAGSDADLKMLALNSVLQRDPAKALPAIRTILSGDGSPQLKQRALSTLAMSQSPDAQNLLRDVALGKIAPGEQRQAIQMLSAFQGKRAGDTLAEIYRTSNDRSIKRSAVSGLFIAGDAPRMVDLARNEKDLQLKHDIVAQLALMHDKAATEYMLELLK